MSEYTIEPIKEDTGYTIEPMPDNNELSFRAPVPSSAPSIWEAITNLFPENAQEEKAKASNALVFSKMLDITPSAAYDLHDQISEQVKNKVQGEEILLKREGYGGAVWKGMQDSLIGMIVRQQPEGQFTSAEFKEELAYGLSKMIADFPVFLVGGLLGKKGAKMAPALYSTMAELGGAMGLHSGLRKVLMDRYEKGEVTDLTDFTDRLTGVVLETAKGEAIGMATGLAKVKTPGPAPVKLASEVATMTLASAALEGHVPTAKDFALNAVMLGLFHYGMKGVANRGEVTKKLMDIYKEDGVHPKDIANAIAKEPVNAKEDIMVAIDRVKTEIKKDLPIEVKEEVKTEQKGEAQVEPTGETKTVQTPIGAPNRVIDALRAEQGMEPITRTSTGSLDVEFKQQVAKDVENGTIDPRNEARKINNRKELGENIVLDERVQEALRYDINRVTRELNEINRQIEEGNQSPELSSFKQQLRDILDSETRAVEASGTAASEVMRGRIEKGEVYEAEIVLGELRKAGIETTPELETKYRKLAKKVDDAKAAREAIEDVASQKLAEKSVEIIRNEEGLKQRKQKRVVKKEELDKEFDDLVSQIAKAHSGQFNVGIDPANVKFLVDMTRNRVKKGMLKAEDIIDSIHVALTNAGIKYSKRDIRDAISKYGVERSKTKTQLELDIAEAKKQMYLLSALEDAEAGKPLPKTGGKKKPDSERVLELKRQVNDAMKESGILDVTARAKFIALKEKQIAEWKRRIKEEDFAPKEKKPERELSKEETDLKFAEEEAKKAFTRAKEADIRKNAHWQAKAFDFAVQAGLLFKNVRSSFDFSMYRQAFMAWAAHPIVSAKGLPASVKALRSAENDFRIRQELQQDPLYPQFKKAGIDLAEVGGGIKAEELVQSRWAERIPLIAGFSRTFTTGLDVIRMEHFKAIYKSRFKDVPPTQAELETLGKLVNQFTGRGTWKSQERFLNESGKFLWAPKLYLSRAQILVGQSAWGATTRMKKIIAWEYARALMTIGAIYSLADLAGWAIGDDPNSSDFGKLIHGDRRVDVLGGLSQTMVLMSRTVTQQKSTISGETYDLVGDDVPYGKDNILGVWGNFLRTKFTPVLGTAVDLYVGKDMIGQPVTLADLPEKTAPMSWGDIYEAMTEEGVPSGVALSMLALLGASTANYNR